MNNFRGLVFMVVIITLIAFTGSYTNAATGLSKYGAGAVNTIFNTIYAQIASVPILYFPKAGSTTLNINVGSAALNTALEIKYLTSELADASAVAIATMTGQRFPGTASAVWTWIPVQASGSTAYIPCWK